MPDRGPASSEWDRGSYELTADELAPVAPPTVDAAEPVENLRLLDLACGTGNASLEAARRGARVTGLDSAGRLLEVAAGRAEAEGLPVDWISGDIHELPFAEDSFEIVTSVFGLIFADRPAEVAAEIGRVLAPSGRLAFTTWLDEGPLARIMAHFRARVDQARKAGAGADRAGADRPGADRAGADRAGAGAGGGPGEGGSPDERTAPLKWGDPDRLGRLFAEHGIAIRCEREVLRSTDESPEARVDSWFDHHPMWLAARDMLEESSYEALRAECLDELRSANEDASGFSISQPYLRASGSPV